MKKYIVDFCHRGLVACGFGPLVLMVCYLILQHNGAIETLTVNQVCLGIFSLSALAFIAGGVNVIHQIERVPLMVAILVQGVVLYGGYLATYLLNDWLEWGTMPVLVFSVIFLLGYLVIWLIIYSVTKKNTEKLNQKLKEKQETV